MIQRIKRGDPIPDYILNRRLTNSPATYRHGKITDQDLQKYIAPAARMQ
jgi:hypothetical protein